jgi:dihydropteroate synthase
MLGSTWYECGRPLIMGILNTSPDSFYPGSRIAGVDRAVGHALDMAEKGADIIDIGGVSTRPGSHGISEEEEMERVVPVVEAVVPRVTVPVSVDTCRSSVARKCLELGASIVNDVSALGLDSGMAETVRMSGASVVLMHMRGAPATMQDNPLYGDVVEEILAFLRERVQFAVERGIPQEKIVVDPGIGFGKTLEHNLAILRNIARFHETGCPVLVGASRKGMIGAITGAPVEDRAWGTAAVTAHCVLNGVEIHRVHDVREMRQVCDVAAALKG